ncbi:MULTISPECIES: GMC family oxidoreductase [unclassified Chelatococcus]|uniref:GMC family oxidoreductase n=1 Tax=unclassified Chelatococcus TaxID=2638111 RepID=UPI001BCB19AC|nr:MULTISPECIES: GMC family oxidoreductase [unclassified Chelatococcus]CAH1660787.1 Gluconate 2-dehydrogenase alpha chain [Hyphomicrobiales bacterium]MBS7741167.1 gluconate 2-dehydrogenase subunit 3 family protein [Chelatococcus sp. HY11]MBX3545353.1 gluconate 2-dehydrogenase subunit 3 family protein [Chelatococcus sp.]MCO5077988.1 gluconate 2-dehydrogenase subunit 3 family protein [Chelatococcus sp.]CAH1683298.1 Gluconate 2-dehydrogenase alpha chain [Hyphomicrobiales bacterium]
MSWVSLDQSQAGMVSALARHIWPADEAGADGADLGVVTYIDRALGGHERAHGSDYRSALAALNAAAQARFGFAFADSSASQQNILITAMEEGQVEGLPKGFFNLLRRHVIEGLFADPAYGGNRDTGGWASIGFPGVIDTHTPEENLGAPVALRGGRRATMGDAERRLDPGPSAPAPVRFGDAVDVVVVGAGGVGALVGPWLAMAGLKVVALEAGGTRAAASSRPDELRNAYYCRAGFGEKFNEEVPSWREGPGFETSPMTFSLGRMCNGVGGSLIHYGARLRRQHPHQFSMRSALSELGLLAGLDPSCTVADWPLGYEDLAEHYEALEWMVGIAGPDEHPFIPRRKGLPMPPARAFAAGEKFGAIARSLGLHPEPVPVGMNTVPWNGRPAMEYSPWGEGMGSPTRSRWMPDDDLIPAALATGNLEIRTHTRVLRVLTDSTGCASGVVCVNQAGHTFEIHARAVILSAYTFENVRLMFLSGDTKRPEGLGNSSGQLGQHFMTKQFPSVYGWYPGQSFNRHTGPGAQGLVVEDMLTPGFMARERLAGGGTLSTENQLLPIQIAREPLPADIPAWGGAWKRHVRSWNERLAIRIQTDTLPYAENRLDLDPLRRDRSGLGLPVVRVTYGIRDHEMKLYRHMIAEAEALHRAMGAEKIWSGPIFTGIGSCHDLGGCRMGEDPSRSVVSPDLEVHDTPGLYVMGGAVFPSCHAVNPTLTIWALCRRATQSLIGRLK